MKICILDTNFYMRRERSHSCKNHALKIIAAHFTFLEVNYMIISKEKGGWEA